MHSPEDQLLERCRDGDTEAFACVYSTHSAVVFRCAFSMLGHYEDARDVSQETFVRAIQAMQGFQGQCTLQTWLLKICANLCRDRRRRSRSRQEVSLETVFVERLPMCVSRGWDLQADLERRERADAIWKALASMPDGQREIIYLRDIEQLGVEEVMEILGCSRVNVNVKLFRARRRLRETVMAHLEAGENAGE
jgi:RNA polymerase sigma-70 factor, ECF subfamily